MNSLDTPSFGYHKPFIFYRLLIFLAHRVPHNTLGRWFAHWVKQLVLWRVPPPVDVEIGPIKMRCVFRDNKSEKRFVFTPWRFDQRERQLLLRSLPRDGVFVDIGANVGIYTLTVATHLGSQGRVLALEPNPRTFARLQFNVNATGVNATDRPRIDLLEMGVGKVTGEVLLYLDQANLGSASIVVRDEKAASHSSGNRGEAIRICCKPLLSILREQSIGRIHALKIDIEGAEDMALIPFLAEAADEELPAMMIIENSESRWKSDLIGSLAGRGYAARIRTGMNTVYCRGLRDLDDPEFLAEAKVRKAADEVKSACPVR